MDGSVSGPDRKIKFMTLTLHQIGKIEKSLLFQSQLMEPLAHSIAGIPYMEVVKIRSAASIISFSAKNLFFSNGRHIISIILE